MTINDELYKRVRRQALERGITVSAFLEEAVVNQLLEDAEDLEAVKQRENEPIYSFDELVKEFKAEGLL